MLELSPKSKKQVLVFRAKGKFNIEDYNRVLGPSVKDVLAKFDKAHVVFVTETDFLGWEQIDQWEADRFSEDFKGRIGKVAFVGEHKWYDWFKRLAPHFGEDNVKTFNPTEELAAHEWAEELKMV